MTALPSVTLALRDNLIPHHAMTIRSVYTELVLPAEAAAKEDRKAHLIAIRVLGYLLLYPLNDVCRSVIAQEIASCNVPFLECKMRSNHLSIYKHKERTPAPSSHSSRSSFDNLQEMIQAVLAQSPSKPGSTKQQALVRDNFRCMVTGRLDQKSYFKYSSEMERPEEITETQCCHIFPNMLGNIETGEKANYVADIWTMFRRFGYRELQRELSGDLIHRLGNVLTLSGNLHSMMDTLELWFEPIEGMKNRYRVQIIQDANDLLHAPKEVEFTTSRDIPLPNPKYLSIHAACCRVAHLSGAAEPIDDIQRDIEELPVLANNGASLDTLTYALQRLAPPV
ncbi:uncharacterized protein LAESUDRAFT_730607 [Laetiporus sulphureus 93-53]|uniref:HNH nuclease domain-containing protein n=1 Tax=Laetiporus sulphureus 93-53 TaxID=1314785 RepID=A0A165C2H9_9APHY|nr:uncharacterized protein LAESUDRAFT_730607 [Laetiporus sulphureus 93-53]KZT02084.1 hypothetical protein LAESUDRAFT_730607 [Laetiporus sulphureus 93-53]